MINAFQALRTLRRLSLVVAILTLLGGGAASRAFAAYAERPAATGAIATRTARPAETAEPTTTPVAGASDEREIFGTVTALSGGSITVDGVEVALTAGTEISGTIAVGSSVKVHVVRGATGGLVAREVELIEGAPAADDNGGDRDDQGDDNGGDRDDSQSDDNGGNRDDSQSDDNGGHGDDDSGDDNGGHGDDDSGDDNGGHGGDDD